MSDQHIPSRNLSEIGHLFLSSVRERQTHGAALPKRQPPAKAPLDAAAASGPRLAVPAPPRLEPASIELSADEAAPVAPLAQTRGVHEAAAVEALEPQHSCQRVPP